MPDLPFLAQYPNASADLNAVSYPTGFTDSIPYLSGATTEIVGGTTPQTYTGKLAQAPGTTDPICWTRGSLQNMGYVADLADKGAVAQTLSYGAGFGQNATYWDAPKAWGNAGFLPRLPNTVILAVYDSDGVIEAQITLNQAYFQAKNISVIRVFPNGGPGNPNTSPYAQSTMWVGLPLSDVNWTTAGIGGGTEITIPSVTPLDASQYSGGKIFVATSSTFGSGLFGYTAAPSPISSQPNGVNGTTSYLFYNASQQTGFGCYVFSDRITADLATIAGIIGGQNWVNYTNNLYWSTDVINSGLPDYYTQAFFLPTSQPDSSLLTPLNALFSGPFFNARQLPGNNGTVTTLQFWNAIFADIQAFFGM